MKNEKKINESKILLIGLILVTIVFAVTIFRPEKEAELEDYTIEESYDYSLLYPREVQKKLAQQNDITLLDIRSIKDFDTSHIKDSVNVPIEVLEGNLSLLNRDNTIIVIWHYTESEVESEAVKILEENEFNKVYVLSGGMEAWKEDTQQVIAEGNPNSFIDNSKVDFIFPEEFNEKRKNYKFYILDVRSRSEYETGHIQGAINIPLEDLENNSEKITSLVEIIAYGNDTMEGFKAGTALFDLGFLNARILDGGMTKWKEKEFEIITSTD